MNTRSNYLLKVALALFGSLLITFLLVLSSNVQAQPNTGKEGNPYQVEHFQAANVQSLNVQTSGGHITVEGTSGTEARIEMYVRKNGRSLTSEDTDLSDWEIDISHSGQSINAIAKRKNNGWGFFNGNNHPSISFIVYTPEEINSNLKTSGGHINASNLSGNQQLKTSGGHIELAMLSGTVDAHTSGGHISGQALNGEIELKTSGGHINLENIDGSLDARTSGGHINASLLSISGSLNLKTSGGNIDIAIPGNTGLELNLAGTFVNANIDNFSGKIERNKVNGELNGGGPLLSARTSGGTVSLSFH